MIHPRKLRKSFHYAFAGLHYAFKSDQNLRVHSCIAVFALILSCFLSLNTYEFSVIVLAIVIVFAAEMINTAIEKMTDLITKEHRVEAEIAKDISSAMVLTAAFGSMIVGIAVFLPHIIALFIS